MKKLKYLLLILLLIPINGFASTNTKDRNELDNLGVNKHWNINENNRQNVLNTKYVDANEKIYDYSDILTDEEEKEIKEKIDRYIEHTNMDMVFVSINLPYTIDSQNEEFAADFYDYNDFGINFESYSGVLLLRNTYEQDPYFNVYMFGKAQLYYSFDRSESMLDNIYPYFKNKNYKEGLNIFIDNYTYYYDQGIPDEMKNYYVDKDSKLQKIPSNYYLDKNNVLHKKPYEIPWLLITIIDLIITIITISILIHKNKMVKKILVTKDYIDKNGVNFTRRENNLVKEYVTHVTRDTSSGGGGGFSSSIGSSGGGHSSGGGRHG